MSVLTVLRGKRNLDMVIHVRKVTTSFLRKLQEKEIHTMEQLLPNATFAPNLSKIFKRDTSYANMPTQIVTSIVALTVSVAKNLKLPVTNTESLAT